MRSFITIYAALLLATVAFGQNCANPKFSDVKTHVTSDVKLNTQTAFAVEFKLECARGTKSVPLYAEIDGKFVASSCDATGTKYQISWTEEHKSAKSGDITLRIFDEEGYFDIKKAQRNDAKSTVQELKTITFNHKTNYRGPYVQSELVAVVFFGAVFYYAMSARSCIQA